MKCIKYITFIVLSFLSEGIMGMQVIQTDFSKPGEDVAILVSSDDIEFTVDTNLARRSKTICNIIEDVGLEEFIPLPTIAARDFERLLILLDKETLEEGLSIYDLVALFEAAEYLDVKEVQGIFIEEINKGLTWNQAAFENIFNSQIPYEVKMMIIQVFAKKIGLDWNENMLTELLNNQNIDVGFKMALVHEIIKQNERLLVQIVPEWNVHVKNCKDQEQNPLACAREWIIETEEDKQLHSLIKRLLGQNYQLIQQRLLEEYPED